MLHKKSVRRFIIVLLLSILFLFNLQPFNHVYAASLRFYNYNTKSNENYTGKQVIYKYNNRELSLSYPGILINGTALADYEDLFVHELGLQAKLVGNKITFSDGTTELVLTLGSKTVSKNGKTATMSVAPVKLQFGNTIKYYVPTRYVAEAFGFSYSWHSDISTVKISKTLALAADDKVFSYNNTLYSVNYKDEKLSTDMPVIYYKGVVLVPAKQIFEGVGCVYNEEENKIQITKNELCLSMEHNNRTAYVNEKKIITDSVPIKITDRLNEKSAIYVSLQFIADMLGFELTYSDKQCSYTLNETELTGRIALYPDLVSGMWKQDITKFLEGLPQKSTEEYPDDAILIPIQEDVEISNISDEDNYWNNNFILKISGNHLDYYKENSIINPYYGVKISDIYYDDEEKQTILSVTTNYLCGYKYNIKNNYIILAIGKPEEIYEKIVVLDAGHGGIDPGAVKNNILEKDLNFSIINIYARELFKDSDIKVYFTRETDIKVNLYDRAEFASEIGADMFISLHMNSNSISSANGTEVYYSTENNKATDSGFNSYRLAKALADNLSAALKTKNRGANKSDFVVVRCNDVPAVLIELGFITNKNDLAKLTDAAYQKKAAEAIYQTVSKLFEQYY